MTHSRLAINSLVNDDPLSTPPPHSYPTPQPSARKALLHQTNYLPVVPLAPLSEPSPPSPPHNPSSSTVSTSTTLPPISLSPTHSHSHSTLVHVKQEYRETTTTATSTLTNQRPHQHHHRPHAKSSSTSSPRRPRPPSSSLSDSTAFPSPITSLTPTALSSPTPSHIQTRTQIQRPSASTTAAVAPTAPQTVIVKTPKGKRHRCTYPGCGRDFSRLSNLKAHWRRHSGEEPYSCMHCNRKFKWRSSLKSHELGCVFEFSRNNANNHHNNALNTISISDPNSKNASGVCLMRATGSSGVGGLTKKDNAWPPATAVSLPVADDSNEASTAAAPWGAPPVISNQSYDGTAQALHVARQTRFGHTTQEQTQEEQQQRHPIYEDAWTRSRPSRLQPLQLPSLVPLAQQHPIVPLSRSPLLRAPALGPHV